jgi:hypothetical protein
MYFLADPAQPLDGNLRATMVRIASAKTAGEFDRHRPFVMSLTWSCGSFQVYCKMLSMNQMGKKLPLEEDVSQLLEKMRISPGAGLLSDGSASICVAPSDG